MAHVPKTLRTKQAIRTFAQMEYAIILALFQIHCKQPLAKKRMGTIRVQAPSLPSLNSPLYSYSPNVKLSLTEFGVWRHLFACGLARKISLPLHEQNLAPFYLRRLKNFAEFSSARVRGEYLKRPTPITERPVIVPLAIADDFIIEQFFTPSFRQFPVFFALLSSTFFSFWGFLQL